METFGEASGVPSAPSWEEESLVEMTMKRLERSTSWEGEESSETFEGSQ